MAISSPFTESLHIKKFFPSMSLKEDLPVSQSHTKETHLIGLRRRISSFSVKIQPLSSAGGAAAWASALRRSKSMSSVGDFAGGPLRRRWDAGWTWLLSRKPSFAKDLEMNEEERSMLGFQSKGSWLHLLYKIRLGFLRLVGSGECLPVKNQAFKYDSYSCPKNFDEVKRFEQ